MIVELSLSSIVATLYEEWVFIRQNVSFPVQEHLKLFQLSGALARRLFCIPWYFVVPHFISFNCKLLNTQFSHKEKETIQSVWSDLMTLLFPDWLTPPLLFFLYIFVIPPGWLGGSVNHCTVNLSILHPYSINQFVTNSNSEPLNSNEAFS